jgi:hypothetical protein
MMEPIENAEQMKRKSRGWSDDMSSHAIARRLTLVSDLYNTWRSLQTAKKVSSSLQKIEEAEEQATLAVSSKNPDQ